MKMLKSGNNFLFFIGVMIMLALFGAGVWFLTSIKNDSENSSPYSVFIREREYVLEVANSNIEREKGLGGRDNLCEECGMLFVFEKPGRHAFWMKDMRFSLDIIWLLGDEVVFVAHNVSPNFSGVIEPDVFADWVIEVNAGVANNIKEGERVKFLR